MTPPEDKPIAAHARVASAMKSAWAEDLAESRPPPAVDTLERALRVHGGRNRDAALRRKHEEFLALLPAPYSPFPAAASRVSTRFAFSSFPING